MHPHLAASFFFLYVMGNKFNSCPSCLYETRALIPYQKGPSERILFLPFLPSPLVHHGVYAFHPFSPQEKDCLNFPFCPASLGIYPKLPAFVPGLSSLPRLHHLVCLPSWHTFPPGVHPKPLGILPGPHFQAD